MNFLNLIKIIRELLAIGAPPDVDDEPKLRAWVQSVVDFFQKLAEQSEVETDDKVIEFLETLVVNDTAWGIAYLIVKSLLSDEDDEKVGAMATSLSAEMEKTGIDPATIIAIVTAVVELLKLWRDRRNAPKE